jgi:hypothetical protein
VTDELRSGFVPVLDGERLRAAGDGFEHEDGAAVDTTREGDIVWVNAEELASSEQLTSTGWWTKVDAIGGTSLEAAALEPSTSEGTFSADDVARVLVTLADSHTAPEPTEVEAGYFHHTLRRWLGASTDADDEARAPLWDYDFWKAELERAGEVPAPGDDDGSVEAWVARVWRGEEAEPEQYRYWIDASDGAIQRSGWLTDPPDLLGGPEPSGAFVAGAQGADPSVVEALLREADER